MESPVFKEPSLPANFNKKDIPVKWGLITAAFLVLLTTVNNLFLLDNYIVFLVATFFSFIVYAGLGIYAGIQQRKAMGGYITFKDAFQVMFIIILIATIISTIYGIVYVKFIDPNFFSHFKAGMLEFMAKMHTPESKLDEVSVQLDEQLKDSLTIGKLLQSVAKSIIIYSIFGMIAALIVRKEKPAYLNN